MFQVSYSNIASFYIIIKYHFIYTTVQKFEISEMKLIRSDSKDIYNITKDFYFK